VPLKRRRLLRLANGRTTGIRPSARVSSDAGAAADPGHPLASTRKRESHGAAGALFDHRKRCILGSPRHEAVALTAAVV
jgi:hypothetical protein